MIGMFKLPTFIIHNVKEHFGYFFAWNYNAARISCLVWSCSVNGYGTGAVLLEDELVC